MTRFADRLRNWLVHPRLRGYDLDDPHITNLRREIILENTFLRQIYQAWYADLCRALPESPGAALELGSGGGFLAKVLPGLITSEVFYCSYVDVILDGQQLPFADDSLRGIVMTNILHHVPKPRQFFHEAARCVRSGGVITMIEPWITPWSRFVYTRLHQEPFDLNARSWEFLPSGPLSGANGALPWILFERDREQFQAEFPQLKLETPRLRMPFRYLLSGGVSLRPFMPGWSFGLWGLIEQMLAPWMSFWAMFAHITLRRV